MAKVVLSSPTEIEGDWEHCWFDVAHQHFLLLSDSYFYLLPSEAGNQAPALFAHIRDLPRSLLCGRVSIDKKIIAIQTSLSSIVVVDVSSKKKWNVEIRHPSENAILTNGIMWSDHGGNSEDLIIVTTKGMELYKISQLRSQCKVSRVISQPVSSYWYNAEHRMVMLAAHAQPKFGYNRNPQSVFFSPEERPKEMLLVDGFFLNCEKPSIPMLELPPPDRVPRLELGPGVGTEDVSLVSLYGKILCLVRYVEHGQDFVTVYHLTKARAERIHCLALNGPTHGLLYSTCDNLLICHCMGERVSLVFDILGGTARGKDGVSSADKTHPLGSAAPMHFVHRHRGAAAGAANAISSARSVSTASHDGRRSSGLLNRGSTSNTAEGDGGRTQSRDAALEWGPLVTPQKRHSRIGQQMMLGKKEADISNFDSLTFSGELGSVNDKVPDTPPTAAGAGAGTAGTGTDTAQYVVLASPEPAQEVYSTYAFEYIAPNRLLDSHRRVLWEVRCSLPALVRDLVHGAAGDPKEIPLFLSRRGQRYCRRRQAAEGVLEYGVNTLEGRLAKQLMLSELHGMLLRRADATALKAYFRGLMRPYGTEYRRLILAQYEALHAQESGQTGTASAVSSPGSAASGGGASLFSMTSAARRRLVPDSFFGAPRNRQASTAAPGSHGGGGLGNMGVYPGLLSLLPGASSPLPPGGSSSCGDAAGRDGAQGVLEGEPLEMGGTMQLMLPDISMVGVRARKQRYYHDQQQQQQSQQLPPQNVGIATGRISPAVVATESPSTTTTSTSAPKIKPTCQVVALHTRRDIFGCVICTQAEILSHVWLPVLLNSDVDFEYSALALTLFVMHLREAHLSVAPAFSALLLNVLFHSQRYVEVSRALQERQLPDSLDLALYSLEFCDMLQDQIDSLCVAGAQQGGNGDSPSSSSSTSIAVKPMTRNLSASELAQQEATGSGSARGSLDSLLRHSSALANMRQAALDVLGRLDERTTLAKWYLSHGRVLEAIAVCKRRNGHWQPPLTPGSIPASEFFQSAVLAANKLMKPLDAEVLRHAASSSACGAGSESGVVGGGVSAKEVRRLSDRREAVTERVVSMFYSLHLFLKEWDGVVLLCATNSGRSRLSAQVAFPDHIFEGKALEQFRKMFGFS